MSEFGLDMDHMNILFLFSLGICLAVGSGVVAQDTPQSVMTVTVPVQVSDLAGEAFGVGIYCELLTTNRETVGWGSTYLIQTKTFSAYREKLEDFYNVQSRVLPDDLTETNTRVDVQIYANNDAYVESWTNGYCQLDIEWGDVALGEFGAGQAEDCGTASPNVDLMSMCAWPGSELVGEVTFVRPGFNADGTLATLPGVDQ